MEIIDLAKVIRTLRPDAEFSYVDEDYSTIKWDALEGSAPTQEEIDETFETLRSQAIQKENENKLKREDLLNRLGISEEEAKLLLQ